MEKCYCEMTQVSLGNGEVSVRIGEVLLRCGKGVSVKMLCVWCENREVLLRRDEGVTTKGRVVHAA